MKKIFITLASSVIMYIIVIDASVIYNRYTAFLFAHEIGDARISWNGNSWRLITETEYNGL